MRLRNTTDIPNETIREVVRFTCPSGVSGYDVKVAQNHTSRLKGKAYPQGSGLHSTASPFINLYIGAASEFPAPPVEVRHRPGYLPMPYFATQLEALVYLAAHELRHLWQARVKRGRRVWGAKGQFSERDADAYALKTLRAWRRK